MAGKPTSKKPTKPGSRTGLKSAARKPESKTVPKSAIKAAVSTPQGKTGSKAPPVPAGPEVTPGRPRGVRALPSRPVTKSTVKPAAKPAAKPALKTVQPAPPVSPVSDDLDDADEVPPEAEIPSIVEISEPAAVAPVPELPAPRDGFHTALTSYMKDVERYPILSREEEQEVARRFRETQDPELAKKLITANLKLVVKIAWEYHNAYKNILDLVQEGNIGLMMAVKNFDPFQGVRLSSYAQYWIRAYILRYLVNSYHLVKLGTTQAQRKLFFNLRKEKAQLEREGFVPTAKLLAERLDVKESEVAEMDQRLSQGEVSLDAPLGPDTDMSLGDTLTGGEPGADDRLADKERMERFRAAMNAYRATLEERDALIFDKRLDTDSPITLQDLGDQFSISKERARQLEERIKLNFRKFLDQNKDKYAI